MLSKISQRTSSLKQIPLWSLYALALLLPIFFLPITGLTSDTGKFVLLYVFAGLGSIGYFFARLRDKKLVLPNPATLFAIDIIPVLFLLGALTSFSFRRNFFGTGADITSVLTIFALATVAFLSFIYLKKEKDVEEFFFFGLVAFGVTFLYQTIRLFVPDTALTLGLYAGKYAALIGKWNDLAIFAGVFFIASLFTYSNKSKLTKYGSWALGALALVLMLIVNFIPVWTVLGLGLLMAYLVSAKQDGWKFFGKKKDKSEYFTGVLILGLVFVIYSALAVYSLRTDSTGNLRHPGLSNAVYFVPNLFGGTPAEVRPSIMATTYIYNGTLKENPLIGTGANTFGEAWNKYRHADVSKSQFGSTEFMYGFGLIPTLGVVGGILGTLALVVVFLYGAFSGINFFSKKNKSTITKAVSAVTIYLAIMSVIYVPAIPLLVALMVCAGYLMAQGKIINIDLKKRRPLLYVVWAMTLLWVVATVLIAQGLVNRYSAQHHYGKSVIAVAKDGNLDEATKEIERAIALDPRDLFFVSAGNIELLKIQNIINQANRQGSNGISESEQSQISLAFENAQKYSEKALEENKRNYANYMFAASILENDSRQAEAAKGLYQQSITYNQYNPNAYLGLARLAGASGDIAGAKENISKALEISPNHTDSLLAQAEIFLYEKNTDELLRTLAQAYFSNTRRVDILLRIATIQENTQKDTKAAINTLEYAVSQNNGYSDGLFTLAGLYAKEGRYGDAVNALSVVVSVDPKSKDSLDPLIKSLEQGENPFMDTAKQN